ncbi:hypothetical protein CGRA01v4_04648 [Colletotrichum graminicola]|uniref:Uncharacterized protein n=1 Tax=Colletotrichum graminicola (strain M1.001 / M2 / FGSC 10212) TaxID=645133 RepID=E3Q928_COLGM|nr:uncharacterized protein GLRG_02037 [Colletotrichum graminicola M1.001]EFQ27542.1 hypothetical protein GLRG_02037 [Colletotrichum graminicola M1.001]WDK13367.1 hypothetical protein CGRA01v4_04648 [Colletotrichum graminicola]
MMLDPLRGPDSPPQTPTSTTPMINHKFTTRPPWHNHSRSTLLEDSGIQPTGNGHEFSFTPSNRYAQLSPRTSSEDSVSNEDDEDTESKSEEDKAVQVVTKNDEDEEEEDSDDEEEDSDDDEESEDEDDDVPMNFPSLPSAPMLAPMPAPMFVPGTARMAVDGSSEEELDDQEDDDEEIEEDDDSDSASESESEPIVTPPAQETHQERHPATGTTAASKANFTLEELSDFDPMDQDRTGTIAPSGFSSPASVRSRSRAPAPKELPPGLTRKMRDLNCGLSSSEDSDEDLDEDEAAHREFVRMQRELRMRKRRSHGSSIGKRTISERSDSDHDDWTPLDPDAVGSSARRLRRRVGDRRSFIHLQFQDPPPARIDELEEPESEVEGTFIFCDSGTLAQELPYYSIEIMEYSTPSP